MVIAWAAGAPFKRQDPAQRSGEKGNCREETLPGRDIADGLGGLGLETLEVVHANIHDRFIRRSRFDLIL